MRRWPAAVGLGALLGCSQAAAAGPPPVFEFVGDSITYGLTRSSGADHDPERDPEGGFPGRLQRILGSRARVLNRGVGGSTTRNWSIDPRSAAVDDFRMLVDLMAPDDFPRIAPAAAARTVLGAVIRADHPDVVVILLGANDLAFDRQAYDEALGPLVARLANLYDDARAAAPTVLVSTILPNRRDVPWILDALNARIRARWPDHLPLGERLDLERRPQLLSDQIHLTAQGYEALARTLAGLLAQRGLVPGS